MDVSDMRAVSDIHTYKSTQAHGGSRILLAALLLIPFALSPAFLSLYLTSDEFANQFQEFAAANWLLGFAYSSILTLFWYRGRGGPRNFVGNLFTWCLRRGSFVGFLYGVLLSAPLEIAKSIYLAGRMSGLNIAGQTIVPAIAIVIMSTLTGLAAGGLLGLALPRFTVRTLLVITTIFAIVLGLMVYKK